jgi:carboxypeptidase Taq
LAREAFPEALADADADAVHEALLAVRPSFIRVEADEVTYNLHVMLRFDLERAVVHGDLSIAELPAAWNDRFERDFGIRPPNAAAGVMQDIHWSAGLIGYFPTYTLGNLYAAQLMAAAGERLGDLDARFASGEFAPLLDWLRAEIHAAGRMLESEPLVERATGRPVSADWLAESLQRRYGPAHGL